jgi:6-phosphogluconolactonase
MIWVYDDYEALSNAAAGLFVQQARMGPGPFTVALSGGDTPRRTYEMLSEPPFAERVPWNHVHVFWGDERCVPASDPRNNAHVARSLLLNHVPIPGAQIHPMRCAESPQRAAEDYERLLIDFFPDAQPRFDLVFLGLGENGHTASLFPHTPVLDVEEWVAAVYLADQDIYRVTLTATAINAAKVVVFLVSGAGKAAVLKQVLEGPDRPRDLPAQLIHPRDGELHWLVDRDAAALLEQRV